MNNILNKIIDHNSKNNLKFIEESHSYFLGEKELLSVTQKISKFFPFNAKKISRDVAERNWVTEDEILYGWEVLRHNGSYIHILAEKYCKEQELSSKEKEVIKAVIFFFDDNPEYKIIASEIKIFSSKYSIAGTIDLILEIDGKLWIVDWKTSNKTIDKKQIFSYAKEPFSALPNNKYNIYSLQLSVYSRILKEEYGIEIWDSCFVHLKPDGTYQVHDRIVLDYEAEELLNY